MKKLQSSITFYQNRQECLDIFNKLTIKDRIYNHIKSYFTLIYFAIQKFLFLFQKNDLSKYTKYQCDSKRDLIVCFHGLGSNPGQFTNLINKFEENDLSDTQIFVPNLLKAGNEYLDKVCEPIYTVIEEWSKKGTSKRLVLIGVSNGGRIAKAIETKLASNLDKETTIEKISLISIVGACKGSGMVDLLMKFGLSPLIPDHLKKEMHTKSSKMKDLHKDWINSLNFCPHIERNYCFIASSHDFHVPNFSSTLMKVPLDKDNVKASYTIVVGHGHISIVHKISDIINNLIFD